MAQDTSAIATASQRGDPALAGVAGRGGRHSFWLDTLIRLVRTKPLGLAGGIVVLALTLIALFAPVLAHYAPADIHPKFKLLGPSATWWLGTDNLGRDVYSRIIYGARVSLTVGFSSVGISIVLATAIGVVSGYFGGLFDTAVQRLVDGMIAFPGLILILTIVAIWGNTEKNVILAIAFFGVAGTSRIMRGATLSVRGLAFIEAAHAMGASNRRIILQHLLPNVMATAITLATLGLGSAILAEASLGFLGLGVPPPNPTWGNMLSGQARQFMQQAPWLAIFPGLVLSLAIFGFNMLGDALRDLLDPRLRGSR
ncbi:MAG: ABC transporter permease [Dehalococcoidia bacterium]